MQYENSHPNKNIQSDKYHLNSSSSFSLFTKTIINLSNMLGPAIVCLPFVMQKSGLLPTIITLLFLCLFSTFSSMCLTETGKLIYGIKNNHYKRFDYNHLISTLINDSIFAHSSKFCVIINHLLYSIICIITLSKTIAIFVIPKFQYLSNMIDNRMAEKINDHQDLGNFFYNIENTILNNEHMIILLFIFFLFFVSFLSFAFKIVKKIFNFLILFSALSMIVLLLAYITNLNVYEPISNINKVVPLFGNDFTYLYGTILFSFSFVSAVPNWTEEEDLKGKNTLQKKAFQYSAFIGIIFKILFAIGFSYLIKFGNDFSMKDFVLTHRKHEDSNIYAGLIVSLVTFLILTLLNGIVNHIDLLYTSIKTHSNFSFNSFYWIIAVFSPWILSLLLLVNGKIFLNLLNWSSIFLIGYVNFILPLLLYVEAINEVEVFENNYKQSAILDFENFVSLKYEEFSMPQLNNSDGDEENVELIPVNNPNLLNIQNILSEIKTRMNKNKEQELEEEAKEKVIDMIYEYDGYYSIPKSYSVLLGSSIFTKRKISLLFYSIILFLFLFMFFTIYFALYNFFINKTLVVNIFLQIK